MFSRIRIIPVCTCACLLSCASAGESLIKTVANKDQFLRNEIEQVTYDADYERRSKKKWIEHRPYLVDYQYRDGALFVDVQHKCVEEKYRIVDRTVLTKKTSKNSAIWWEYISGILITGGGGALIGYGTTLPPDEEKIDPVTGEEELGPRGTMLTLGIISVCVGAPLLMAGIIDSVRLTDSEEHLGEKRVFHGRKTRACIPRKPVKTKNVYFFVENTCERCELRKTLFRLETRTDENGKARFDLFDAMKWKYEGNRRYRRVLLETDFITSFDDGILFIEVKERRGKKIGTKVAIDLGESKRFKDDQDKYFWKLVEKNCTPSHSVSSCYAMAEEYGKRYPKGLYTNRVKSVLARLEPLRRQEEEARQQETERARAIEAENKKRQHEEQNKAKKRLLMLEKKLKAQCSVRRKGGLVKRTIRKYIKRDMVSSTRIIEIAVNKCLGPLYSGKAILDTQNKFGAYERENYYWLVGLDRHNRAIVRHARMGGETIRVLPALYPTEFVRLLNSEKEMSNLLNFPNQFNTMLGKGMIKALTGTSLDSSSFPYEANLEAYARFFSASAE